MENVNSSQRSYFKVGLVIVIFFVFSFFIAYGVMSIPSGFLSETQGFDFETTGANAVANYWGLMTIGGILGLVLLKFLDSKVILRYFTLITMFCLLLDLFGPGKIAMVALPATGFFMSVMYPIIISLALNSVDKHHGSFAGINDQYYGRCGGPGPDRWTGRPAYAQVRNVIQYDHPGLYFQHQYLGQPPGA